MSEKDLTCCEENAEAAKIIERTITDLVGRGVIHSRDDIIRHLCGGGFTISGVTDDSIAISTPDEPENTLTLSGWLFSGQFILSGGLRDVSQAIPVSSEKPGMRDLLLRRALRFAGYALLCVVISTVVGYGIYPSGRLPDDISHALEGVAGVMAVSFTVMSAAMALLDKCVAMRAAKTDREAAS